MCVCGCLTVVLVNISYSIAISQLLIRYYNNRCINNSVPVGVVGVVDISYTNNGVYCSVLYVHT